jgi:transcription initiation factor TFIIIB Brf1 subunit/transcription initiation factor TFIIB
MTLPFFVLSFVIEFRYKEMGSMNEERYFVAIVKCGHVGKNKYIEKELTFRAVSRKEAAAKARNYPRVKHHWKDAIIDVIEVDKDEYKRIRAKNYNDPYFSAKSIQEQRMYCKNIYGSIKEVIKEEKHKEDRNIRISYLMKKRKIAERLSMIY